MPKTVPGRQRLANTRVHIDGVVVDILAVAQILPMLAAISGAEGAANLDRGVEQIRLGGAGVEPQYPLRRVGARGRRDFRKVHTDRQPRPMFAGVVAAIDLAVLVADEHHVRIERADRMDQTGKPWSGMLTFSQCSPRSALR